MGGRTHSVPQISFSRKRHGRDGFQSDSAESFPIVIFERQVTESSKGTVMEVPAPRLFMWTLSTNFVNHNSSYTLELYNKEELDCWYKQQQHSIVSSVQILFSFNSVNISPSSWRRKGKDQSPYLGRPHCRRAPWLQVAEATLALSFTWRVSEIRAIQWQAIATSQ